MKFLAWVRKNWFNVLLGTVFVWLLIQRIPGWVDGFKAQGQIAPPLQVLNLEGQQTTIPTVSLKPYILIFWATWCGPCKVELARYNEAIIDGDLNGDFIYAVSIGENPHTVKNFALEKDYKFNVFADPENLSSSKYPIYATPTVVHVDEASNIIWLGAGISPFGVWRAEQLLPAP